MISGGTPSRFSSPSTNTTTKHADAAALSSSSTSTRFSLPRSSIMPKRLIPPSTRPLHSTSPERSQQQAPPPTTRPLHSSSPSRKLVPSPPRVTHQQLRHGGGTPTHSSAVVALSPREHVHHQHPYALELRRYHAGRIFEAKVFQNEDHNSDVVKRIAASHNDSGGAAVAFVLDFLIGGINYAHLEAACTSPQHTGLNPHRLEDIIGGELLGLLHRANLFSRDHRITFDVRLQAGAVNTLSLQVEDEVNATISNVRIIGGEWPSHVRVTAHAADADDMRRVHLHFDPVLRHWLAASPFQDSLLFIKSLLGPEVRARPTITDVRLDGRLLFQPDNGEMVRQPDAAAVAPPHVEKADAMTSPFVPAITFNGAGPSRSPSHRSATTIADNNNHIVTSRSVSRSIMADINTDEPSSTRREVTSAITHSDPRKAYLSDSDDEIRTPKVRRVAQQQHQQQQPHHSHQQEVHHFLSSQQTISSTVSVDLPQPSLSRPRLATTQQRKSIFSLASPPRSSLSPDLSRPLSPPVTARTSTHSSSARGSPARHISTPSPSRHGSPSRGRSAGSLLLRVSTSPMRSEDYYVVGGVQLSHVDVTIRVPVQVRSWRVCDICETKLRNLLLSRREMLEYYARDDLYELLSKASRDPTYGGSPRSAQALLNCARHVMVSLDVVSAADPIDANEQSDSLITIGSSHHHQQQQQDGSTAARDLSPSVTILFVCSILCENLVEKLLVSELWSSVERERLLLHATQGTLMFRRLLKEVVAMIATGDPVSGGTADGLVSLVTSVPASLKGCQLSIGGKIAWTGLSTAVGAAAAPVRVSQPPHEYHNGEYHSRNVASSPSFFF
ncbi:Hypothetical protein, putative [Bodo saltans]|uniref:Uncharacterized protein n=1 Tax=Bodo saltans TaxID=75058 RepID=A0A0S4ISH1_BODSA|nr:Hypothetical protein, putative [Bodo saltans]|eukprot:CUF58980.1 Hypothetical protein, putative [Bodo saltans]